MATSTIEIIIRGGFDAIKVTHFRTETLRKGKELQEHIFNVEETISLNQSTICGQILRTASVKEKPYSVVLEFDLNRNFLDGRCSCVAGINIIKNSPFYCHRLVLHNFRR